MIRQRLGWVRTIGNHTTSPGCWYTLWCQLFLARPQSTVSFWVYLRFPSTNLLWCVPVLHCHCSVAAFCCYYLFLLCIVTAVSLHFGCSRFALSLQGRCILMLWCVPVLHCHCCIAAFCCYYLFPFCIVTAMSLHFVVISCSRFALSLQRRCMLLLLVVPVLHCHCSAAAFCCY